jgi:hypothetical protein
MHAKEPDKGGGKDKANIFAHFVQNFICAKDIKT